MIAESPSSIGPSFGTDKCYHVGMASGAGPLAHWPLLSVSVISLVVGGLLCAWLVKRFGRALFRHPQPAVGWTRHVLAIGFAALFVGVGLAAAGLMFALQSYDMFTRKRLVAEVQCIEMAPSRLRVFYVPIDHDGARGATETYDIDGDQWAVGADVLRFKPF